MSTQEFGHTGDVIHLDLSFDKNPSHFRFGDFINSCFIEVVESKDRAGEAAEEQLSSLKFDSILVEKIIFQPASTRSADGVEG